MRQARKVVPFGAIALNMNGIRMYRETIPTSLHISRIPVRTDSSSDTREFSSSTCQPQPTLAQRIGALIDAGL